MLNVVNLTAVKIVAPVKRLQTKTQVKFNKFIFCIIIMFFEVSPYMYFVICQVLL